MDLVVNYYEGEMRKKDEEVDYWKRKFFVLQSQCVLQKEELDVYRVKLDGLCIDLQEKKLDSYLVKGKLKDLTEDVVSTAEENDELKYNTMCEKLKEQIEELKTRCQQESMSQAESKMKCEADFERQLKDCKIQCSEMYEELKRYKMKCDQLDQQNEEFKGRCKELAARVEKQVGLETELTHYKAKYGELYVRFQEGNERVVALETDLKEYTRICSELNEQVESLDGKVRATSNEAGKCIDKLSKEIVQLGDEKRKVEDVSKVLKTKLRKLEGKTALYLEELDGYKVKCHGFSKKEKEMDSVEYESKLRDLALTTKSYVDELECYKMALNGLKEQIKGLAEDQKSFSAREKKAEETIAYLQEVIKGSREEKCVQPSGESKLYPPPNADRDEHVSGPTMSTAKQSEPVVNLNRDKENDASLFKMEFTNGTNEKINFEIEERERAVFKQDNLEQAGIIHIRPKHTYDSGSKQELSISTGKKGEEYGVKRKAAGIPLSSAPKSKRLPETVTSARNKSPICKLQAKKLEERTDCSPANVCTGDIAVSSKVQTAEHYVATLRRRLVSQRRTCPKKNSQADGASKDENTKSDCLVVAVGSSQDKVGSLATENDDGDKVAEEADSDSSGDNEPLKFYM